MSWFSGPNFIEMATSEKMPNGQQDIALNLDICDMVRSNKIPPQDALKQLKPRLMHINPDIQTLALHLLDLLVKNGGRTFLEKFASEESMKVYTGQIRSQHIQGRGPEVVQLMLEYIQQWAYMTKDLPLYKEIWTTYQRIKPDYDFPPLQNVNSAYVEAQVAPEWVDSDTCMKSGQSFTFYNRKHHCRNCGGVYLQEYCKDFIPLPKYGLTEPVRVCVDCKAKLDGSGKPPSSRKGLKSNNSTIESSFERDLRKALEASLAPDTAFAPQESTEPQEEMDEDLKAAIAASLADMQGLATAHQQHQQQQQQQQQYYAGAANMAPMPRHIDQGLVTQEDFDRVETLKQLLQNATPQDAIYDQRIANGERHAVSVQPRVVKDLTDAADKLQTLEDLHSRIVSISAYYDKFLDAELQRASGAKPEVPAKAQVPPRMASQPAPSGPSYAPAYSQPLSHQTTGVSAPSAPPAPAASAPPLVLPSAPTAPIKDPELKDDAEVESESQHEHGPEEEAMLIEL